MRPAVVISFISDMRSLSRRISPAETTDSVSNLYSTLSHFCSKKGPGGNGFPSFRFAPLNKDRARFAPTATLHCYPKRRMAGVAFKVNDGSNTFHPIHQPLRIFF
jgi:hypothetical protein